MKDKCCGNCVYGDDGVCGHPTDSVGEITTDFLCENYKKQLCDMGGDAEHCEDCSYYPDYKFDRETGQCMKNKEEYNLEKGAMCSVCGDYYFFTDGHRCQRI